MGYMRCMGQEGSIVYKIRSGHYSSIIHDPRLVNKLNSFAFKDQMILGKSDSHVIFIFAKRMKGWVVDIYRKESTQ